MAGCKDHALLALLAQKPGQEKRFKASNILSPKIGEWILNPALVPERDVARESKSSKSVPSKTAAQAGNKRSFVRSELGSSNEEDYNSGKSLNEQQPLICVGQDTAGLVDGYSGVNKRLKSAGPNAPVPHI